MCGFSLSKYDREESHHPTLSHLPSQLIPVINFSTNIPICTTTQRQYSVDSHTSEADLEWWPYLIFLKLY